MYNSRVSQIVRNFSRRVALKGSVPLGGTGWIMLNPERRKWVRLYGDVVFVRVETIQSQDV